METVIVSVEELENISEFLEELQNSEVRGCSDTYE